MMKGRLSPKRGQLLGNKAEQSAQQWLIGQGLAPLYSNYHCKAGEIDLIMRQGETLVFVEVRYRSKKMYGSGLESVDWRKQKKLIQAARHFLVSQRHYNNCPCRFDVIAGSPLNQAGIDTIQWHWVKDAFGTS